MGSEPKFDLGNLSWRDSKALAMLQMQTQAAQTNRDIPALEAAFAGMEHFLSRVVVDVPREWLVKDAPAELDWAEPDSFNHLKARSMRDLMVALGKAQTPEEASFS